MENRKLCFAIVIQAYEDKIATSLDASAIVVYPAQKMFMNLLKEFHGYF